MLFIVLSGIVGARATFFALWSYDAFGALLAPARGHDNLLRSDV
jgi:hypothetical protein